MTELDNLEETDLAAHSTGSAVRKRNGRRRLSIAGQKLLRRPLWKRQLQATKMAQTRWGQK